MVADADGRDQASRLRYVRVSGRLRPPARFWSTVPTFNPSISPIHHPRCDEPQTLNRRARREYPIRLSTQRGREAYRTEIRAAALEALQQFTKILDATRESVQLGDDNGVNPPGAHQGENRSMPGRWRRLADSPPSTRMSINSALRTTAIICLPEKYMWHKSGARIASSTLVQPNRVFLRYAPRRRQVPRDG